MTQLKMFLVFLVNCVFGNIFNPGAFIHQVQMSLEDQSIIFIN